MKRRCEAKPRTAPGLFARPAAPLQSSPLDVSFNADGSYDPDGSLIAYSWDFGDGSSSTLANPIHTYAALGSYQSVLTVTDNLGLTHSDSLTITVYGVALPPDQAVVAAPGQSVPYALTVNYLGAEPTATFDVDVSISGEPWSVEVPAAIGPIASGGSASLPVIVHVPADAAGGAMSVVEITLTSQGGTGLITTTVLTTRLPNRIFLPILLDPVSP